MKEYFEHIGALGLIGLVAGIGALFASKESLTWRLIVGRCISSFMLGVAAASILVWFPDVNFYAECGIAAALASIGTSGLERLIKMYLTKRGERNDK